MAVVALKATTITNDDADPPVKNAVTVDGARNRTKVGTVEVTNGDSIGSTYRLARVPSNARITAITLYCDAITSGAADVGIYQTAANGGAVVLATAYATAQSIASAIVLGTNVAFEARDIANIEKRVWEDAGLSADTGRQYDIVATLTAAATASGTLSAAIFYDVD